MFKWSLTVTDNQIAVLRHLKPRTLTRPNADDGSLIPQFIAGARTLEREGLLERVTNGGRGGRTNVEQRGFYLTPRGRFILEMIETDIDRFLNPHPVSVAAEASARGRRKRVA